ncbi:hypothetical protein BS50DRAFT_267022 [Corynespora cassiicola Philippines]|uniref:Low temperature requirement A n=1 Tax=Corynespora cassiicola Philippines TaxID=1448308 RepID=A0A2T2NZN1_CORCC|nr:hypothetical protein BS50DRAFT_267022 [Corynespora cassiicola Philippines]
MGHEAHAHAHEEKPLTIFASPLVSHPHDTVHISPTPSLQKHPEPHTDANSDPSMPPFTNADCTLHTNPNFHHHAEATTAELFYDLFFVANLTTFTSNLEINDRHSLTAYIGFFSLLWLTWYQVSLYDVRFSADSVFERTAKALHFGVMVGFAVIGPQWKPGEAMGTFKIWRAFGLILMVSRITLFFQYATTLAYTRRAYPKTVLPLCLVMASTLVAAVLYGGLTAAFPKTRTAVDELGYTVYELQKSEVYIAWYVIGICETILTVAVSCVWRVISFKGTHMVQRMSLLTLIILGEGIIVICKSISKIVKNEYLWSAAVVGQIIAAILIIYFLYMLYFDRMQEEHFGSIKQQLWSFMHFPLHVVLVLVLQGVSLLIIWRQAVEASGDLIGQWMAVAEQSDAVNATGLEFAQALNTTSWDYVFYWIPKGVDATKEIDKVDKAVYSIAEGYEWVRLDETNTTALQQFDDGINELTAATLKTLFDTFGVSLPKKKKEYTGKSTAAGFEQTFLDYFEIFELVVFYVFIAGGLSLILTTILGYISLPAHKRRPAEYVRLGINGTAGFALCLLVLIRYNPTNLQNYMGSAWMIPTICLVLFGCVVVNHIRRQGR